MVTTNKWLSISGILHCTPEGTGKPFAKYVYQKTLAGHGNIPGDPSKRQQVRLWVAGTYSNTPAQQPQHARFAQGVAAWHALTSTEKETWRAPGSKLRLNRFQAFMRDWCRTKPLPSGTIWDGGTTIWDGGTTFWDSGTTFWDGGTTIWDGGATIWV